MVCDLGIEGGIIVSGNDRRQANLYVQGGAIAAVSEGMRVQGFPLATYLRGKLVAQNGKVVASPGAGRFIPGPGARQGA